MPHYPDIWNKHQELFKLALYTVYDNIENSRGSSYYLLYAILFPGVQIKLEKVFDVQI